MKYHSKLNLSVILYLSEPFWVPLGSFAAHSLNQGKYICSKKGPTHLSKMHDFFFGEKQIILQMSELGNAALLFLGIFLRAIKVACQANFLKLSIHYFLVFVDLE